MFYAKMAMVQINMNSTQNHIWKTSKALPVYLPARREKMLPILATMIGAKMKKEILRSMGPTREV